MEQFSLPQPLLDFVLEVLRETNEQDIETRDDILKNHYQNLQDAQKRIVNLLTFFISEGNASRELLSEEEFKDSKKSLVRKKIESKTGSIKFTKNLISGLSLQKEHSNLPHMQDIGFIMAHQKKKLQFYDPLVRTSY